MSVFNFFSISKRRIECVFSSQCVFSLFNNSCQIENAARKSLSGTVTIQSSRCCSWNVRVKTRSFNRDAFSIFCSTFTFAFTTLFRFNYLFSLFYRAFSMFFIFYPSSLFLLIVTLFFYFAPLLLLLSFPLFWVIYFEE